MPEDLLSKPAIEQAALVRSGQVAAVELVEASLEAIDRLNDRLGAFVTVCAERAIREARAVGPGDDRPLAGVPLAVKDLALTEGVRTTMGSAAMDDWVPGHDSAVVRRLRAAGAVVVGKTNTPELGILAVTEPARFGPARNPWDPDRTAGGSSGGSAAAVAAGMLAIAHGSDGGGSIRNPASCCGLVGLKPSRGRVSPGPDAHGLGAALGVDGALTRTVGDTALLLETIAGYETGDPYWLADPAAPFTSAAGRPPARLRVALATGSPTGAPVDPSCEAAAIGAAELLESLGHRVEQAAPAWDSGMMDAFLSVWIAVAEAAIRGSGHLRGEPLDRARLEPLTREMGSAAAATPAGDFLEALGRLGAAARRVVGFWADRDVLVTPTLAQLPLAVGELRAARGEPAIRLLDRGAEFTPFTPIWNVTGQPAVSLPLGRLPDGVPIGVQLVGPPAGEELLLSLAAELEEAASWHECPGPAEGRAGAGGPPSR